jgi:magnesium transporter
MARDEDLHDSALTDGGSVMTETPPCMSLRAPRPSQCGSLDEEDNTLRPSFIRRVTEALDAEDQETVYNLVEPLHPADIADLFELIGPDYRVDLARAINDLLGSEVIAELQRLCPRRSRRGARSR